MSAREQFGDHRMDRLQARIMRLEKLVDRCPFIEGSGVENAPISTSATRVEHRLGRTPAGVIVLKGSPDSALGFSASQPDDTTIAVNLEASAAATFTLWFW